MVLAREYEFDRFSDVPAAHPHSRQPARHHEPDHPRLSSPAAEEVEHRLLAKTGVVQFEKFWPVGITFFSSVA